MRTNPFYDAWLFLTGMTGEHRASGVGWLLTALFLALLVRPVMPVKNEPSVVEGVRAHDASHYDS